MTGSNIWPEKKPEKMPHEQSIDFAVKFQESLITISNENKEINATLHNINRKNKWPSRWTRTSYILYFQNLMSILMNSI